MERSLLPPQAPLKHDLSALARGVALVARGSLSFHGKLISQDPKLYKIFQDTLKDLLSTGKPNTVTKYYDIAKQGRKPTMQEAVKAWKYFSTKFLKNARNRGYEDLATVHHCNYTKRQFPDIVLHPDHLEPFFGRELMRGTFHPHHYLSHLLTTSGTRPYTDPVKVVSQVVLNPNAWTWYPPPNVKLKK
jgi:hypothetical protein